MKEKNSKTRRKEKGNYLENKIIIKEGPDMFVVFFHFITKQKEMMKKNGTKL